VEKSKEIKAGDTVVRDRERAIDVTAYVAAIALAGAAAWFSIRGMVVLFPGSPMSVVGMAIAMETAKSVTAGWLARRWRATAWVWRGVLVALVAGLAVINAAGVYAQLVAAHIGERAHYTLKSSTRLSYENFPAIRTHFADSRVPPIDMARLSVLTDAGIIVIGASWPSGSPEPSPATTFTSSLTITSVKK
jgi:hypothetical protein